jgi:hypothetical protein
MTEQPGGTVRRRVRRAWRRDRDVRGPGRRCGPRIVTRRPRATVRSRCSRAAPGIRPETLRSPATGSLTVEGLRPVRALRSDHPTWGLAAGCEERTRPETKSAAPVADQTPPMERRQACASSPMRRRASPARTNQDVAPRGAPSPLDHWRGRKKASGEPRAANNRGDHACLHAVEGYDGVQTLR